LAGSLADPMAAGVGQVLGGAALSVRLAGAERT
jgi:hypothetical protein